MRIVGIVFCVFQTGYCSTCPRLPILVLKRKEQSCGIQPVRPEHSTSSLEKATVFKLLEVTDSK